MFIVVMFMYSGVSYDEFSKTTTQDGEVLCFITMGFFKMLAVYCIVTFVEFVIETMIFTA
jgi:hypothetical protein